MRSDLGVTVLEVSRGPQEASLGPFAGRGCVAGECRGTSDAGKAYGAEGGLGGEGGPDASGRGRALMDHVV